MATKPLHFLFAILCVVLVGCGLFDHIQPSTQAPPGRAVARSVVLQATSGYQAIATTCSTVATGLDNAGNTEAAEKLVYNCVQVLSKTRPVVLVAAKAVDQWGAEPSQTDQQTWQLVGCAAKFLVSASTFLAEQFGLHMPPPVVDALNVTQTALQFALPSCKAPNWQVKTPPAPPPPGTDI